MDKHDFAKAEDYIVSYGLEPVKFSGLSSTEIARIELATRAALEMAQKNRWQPIETAPRDGTYIILYRPFVDSRQRTVVQEGKFFKYGMADSWRVRSGGVWHLSAPTHWTPLPEPPKKDE